MVKKIHIKKDDKHIKLNFTCKSLQLVQLLFQIIFQTTSDVTINLLHCVKDVLQNTILHSQINCDAFSLITITFTKYPLFHES